MLQVSGIVFVIPFVIVFIFLASQDALKVMRGHGLTKKDKDNDNDKENNKDNP